MSYINMKSRRSFDFFAPYTEEGDRCVQIPFPVAVTRKTEGKSLVHDCNPQIVDIAAETAATTFELDTRCRPVRCSSSGMPAPMPRPSAGCLCGKQSDYVDV